MRKSKQLLPSTILTVSFRTELQEDSKLAALNFQALVLVDLDSPNRVRVQGELWTLSDLKTWVIAQYIVTHHKYYNVDMICVVAPSSASSTIAQFG